MADVPVSLRLCFASRRSRAAREHGLGIHRKQKGLVLVRIHAVVVEVALVVHAVGVVQVVEVVQVAPVVPGPTSFLYNTERNAK